MIAAAESEEGMRKTKAYVVMGMAVMLGSSLFLGGQTEAKEDTEVTLTAWIAKTFNPDADARLEERIKSFADVNDRVKEVKVETFPQSDGLVKWNAAIESGNVPDVSFIGSDVYNSFVELGVLKELDELVEKIEENSSPIMEGVKDYLTINGHIYSVPLYSPANMLHYRTDIFEEAGISEAPQTWEEMEEICAILKEKTDMYPLGLAISNCDDSETANQWILRSFGGRYWDEEGNVVVNSPETINAINYITNLYQQGYVPPTAVEWDSSGNNKTYMSGESAMVINVTTLYNSLLADDLIDTLGKNTSVCHSPLGDYEAWREPGTIMLSVFEDCKNLELSEELLLYVMDSDWYEEYMDMNYPVSVPVYEKTSEAEVWKSGLGKSLMDQCTSAMENRSYGYPCTDSAVMRADAQAQKDFLFSKTLLKVILNGQTPEEAVGELEQQLNDLKNEIANRSES